MRDPKGSFEDFLSSKTFFNTKLGCYLTAVKLKMVIKTVMTAVHGAAEAAHRQHLHQVCQVQVSLYSRYWLYDKHMTWS